MNKPIRTYDDLIRHRQEVDMLLEAQKEVLISDIRMLKAEFKSATSALGVVGRIVGGKNKHSILNQGVGKAVDMLIKKVLLSRSGWITKTVVGFLAKNLSSSLVEANKTRIVDKLFGWLKHSRGNGKAAPEAYSEGW